MIASAQFTIISLCDVVTSDTPPENPYEGQLWVDTSVTPPETKIWDGNEWVVQNDIETIRTTISILTEKDAQFQQTIDGLNSYVATLTETVETVSNDQGVLEERVLNSESRVSEAPKAKYLSFSTRRKACPSPCRSSTSAASTMCRIPPG